MKIFSERMVLPSDGGELQIQPATLHVEDDVITHIDVGPLNPADSDVENLGHHLVTPAFINAHTHLSLGCARALSAEKYMRGNVVENLFFTMEEKLTAADVRAFTRVGAYESLCAGVGTVWDHYYYAEAVADGILDAGITGVIAPTLQDIRGPGVPHLAAQLEATETLAGRLGKDGIVAAVGPHATDTVSDDLWREVAAFQDRLQIPIHAHVAQSIEEVERSFSLHGCSPVERLHRLDLLDGAAPFLLVHSLFVSHQDLDRLIPEKNILGYCPYSQVQFAFPAAVSSWMDRGLSVVLGTDCGASNDTMNMQQELRVAFGAAGFGATWSRERTRFEEEGTLEAAQALQHRRIAIHDQTTQERDLQNLLSWTWQGAGALHPDLPVGSLEAGQLANLCVWNLDGPATWPDRSPFRALVLGDMNGALHHMMMRGKWRGERGNFRKSIVESAAYREALREANQRLDSLLSRI